MKKLSTFQRIRELKPPQAMIFAASVLSRMTPHYTLYFEAHGEPEQAPLAEHILHLVWQRIADPKQSFNLNVQIEKLEASLPDPATDDAFGVLPAVDAGLGLIAVLRFWQNTQDDAPVMVAKLAQGGVEAFLLATDLASQYASVQAITDEEEYDVANRQLNQQIKTHPLMAFETEWQNSLLDALLHNKSSNKALAAECQKRVSDTGCTTLGIEL